MQIKHSSIVVEVLFLLGISIAISISISKSMADARMVSHSSSPATSAGVYIVYTEKPAATVEPESHHLSTLASVLGRILAAIELLLPDVRLSSLKMDVLVYSEEAAKESLVYVYKNAATGFSAKLTPAQASQLEKQPGVIQVVPNKTLQLHSGAGMTNMRT
ncbi:hypothetical protein Cgig2_029548 [Carnegiea gigantea]|uniref:Inhibitor I9 domain-containing protein n=1 Tax=Carnegiea gigantea TaxID=171969 RepID=A0A9Q1KLY6_9CARY|nr:hypothetical protein Cgig2_029548 [Carnegiea gigantea]